MLTVLLIDSKQEKGQHQADHQRCRRVIAHAAPCEKIGGNPNHAARAETKKLSGGQAKNHLALDLCEIFGNWNKWHSLKSCAGEPAGFPGVPPFLAVVEGDYSDTSFPLGFGADTSLAGGFAVSCSRIEGFWSTDSSTHFSDTRAQKSTMAVFLSSW